MYSLNDFKYKPDNCTFDKFRNTFQLSIQLVDKQKTSAAGVNIANLTKTFIKLITHIFKAASLSIAK